MAIIKLPSAKGIFDVRGEPRKPRHVRTQPKRKTAQDKRMDAMKEISTILGLADEFVKSEAVGGLVGTVEGWVKKGEQSAREEAAREAEQTAMEKAAQARWEQAAGELAPGGPRFQGDVPMLEYVTPGGGAPAATDAAAQQAEEITKALETAPGTVELREALAAEDLVEGAPAAAPVSEVLEEVREVAPVVPAPYDLGEPDSLDASVVELSRLRGVLETGRGVDREGLLDLVAKAEASFSEYPPEERQSRTRAAIEKALETGLIYLVHGPGENLGEPVDSDLRRAAGLKEIVPAEASEVLPGLLPGVTPPAEMPSDLYEQPEGITPLRAPGILPKAPRPEAPVFVEEEEPAVVDMAPVAEPPAPAVPPPAEAPSGAIAEAVRAFRKRAEDPFYAEAAPAAEATAAPETPQPPGDQPKLPSHWRKIRPKDKEWQLILDRRAWNKRKKAYDEYEKSGKVPTEPTKPADEAPTKTTPPSDDEVTGTVVKPKGEATGRTMTWAEFREVADAATPEEKARLYDALESEVISIIETEQTNYANLVDRLPALLEKARDLAGGNKGFDVLPRVLPATRAGKVTLAKFGNYSPQDKQRLVSAASGSVDVVSGSLLDLMTGKYRRAAEKEVADAFAKPRATLSEKDYVDMLMRAAEEDSRVHIQQMKLDSKKKKKKTGGGTGGRTGDSGKETADTVEAITDVLNKEFAKTTTSAGLSPEEREEIERLRAQPAVKEVADANKALAEAEEKQTAAKRKTKASKDVTLSDIGKPGTGTVAAKIDAENALLEDALPDEKTAIKARVDALKDARNTWVTERRGEITAAEKAVTAAKKAVADAKKAGGDDVTTYLRLSNKGAKNAVTALIKSLRAMWIRSAKKIERHDNAAAIVKKFDAGIGHFMAAREATPPDVAGARAIVKGLRSYLARALKE